jgi:hypothetical protein
MRCCLCSSWRPDHERHARFEHHQEKQKNDIDLLDWRDKEWPARVQYSIFSELGTILVVVLHAKCKNCMT